MSGIWKVLAVGVMVFAVACTSSEPAQPEKITIYTTATQSVPDGREFSLAAGADIAADTREVWVWEPPTEAEISALASRLGVKGEVSKLCFENSCSWTVEDENTAALEVSSEGAWTATSNSLWDEKFPAGLQECLDAVESQDGTLENPDAPGAIEACFSQEESRFSTLATPPPGYDEVLSRAREIFPEGVEFTQAAREDDSMTLVEVSYIIQGNPPVPFGYYQVSSSLPGTPERWAAAGRVGNLVKLDGYTTMSAAGALDRIGDYRFSMEYGDATVYIDGEQTTTEVILVSVEPALVPLFDAQGRLLWVPGYRYSDKQGSFWSVVALADKHLEEVSSPQERVVDTGELPEGAAGLVGEPEETATDLAAGYGWSVRVVARDGENFMVTQDYNPDRVNFVVDGGVVTSVRFG